MLNGFDLPLRVGCVAVGTYSGYLFWNRFAPYEGQRKDKYLNISGLVGAIALGMVVVPLGGILGYKLADGLISTAERVCE